MRASAQSADWVRSTKRTSEKAIGAFHQDAAPVITSVIATGRDQASIARQIWQISGSEHRRALRRPPFSAPVRVQDGTLPREQGAGVQVEPLDRSWAGL